MTPPFSSCVWPIPPEEFLSSHRGKQPVYLPGAPDRYASLLAVEDIGQLLSRTVLGLGTVRVRLPEGRQVALDDFSTPVDINRDRRAMKVQVLENYLKAGATLSVEHCESYLPSIHAMCCTLAEAFVARVYATLFLVYAPERPCGLHWDDRDMFICQVAGRKNWPVYKPQYENPFLDPRRVTYKSPVSELFQEFKLQAGDGLYIPRGWAHDPAAVDGSSVHVAFAIATPTGIDLLDWIRADLREASAEVRADLPIPLPASQWQAHTAKLREIVMERLSDEAIMSYYRRHKMSIEPRAANLPSISLERVEDRAPTSDDHAVSNSPIWK
jgi:ribosomal protein L16 Arg81 hydroxylase